MIGSSPCMARHIRRRPATAASPPWEYLRERGVNLVIHRPGFDCRGRQEPDPHTGLPLVLIPLQRGPCPLEAWYLTAHPRVDSLVAEGRVKLQRPGFEGGSGAEDRPMVAQEVAKLQKLFPIPRPPVAGT